VTPHDVLISHLVAIKRELEVYIEEFDPVNGDTALAYLTRSIVYATKFVDEE